MKLLSVYACLVTSVVFGGDTGGTRTVTFDGVSLSDLTTKTTKFALTQSTSIKIPMDVSHWSTVAALAGSLEAGFKTTMESEVKAECTKFTSDWPQYTFTFVSISAYTETFTSPDVTIQFSIAIDAKHEVTSTRKKRSAVVTSSDISVDIGYRMAALIDAAANDFGTAVLAGAFSAYKSGAGSFTVSTDTKDVAVDTEIDACAVTPCSVAHGVCTDKRGSDSTAAGRTCEVNACTDNPCHADASINAGYTCTDKTGEDNTADGRTCVDNVCATEDCNGNGDCSATKCTCSETKAVANGLNTATHVFDTTKDDCTLAACSASCLHGGLCKNNPTPKCDCSTATFTGNPASQVLSLTTTDCAYATCSSTCQNGGVCENSASPACNCASATVDTAKTIIDPAHSDCRTTACPGASGCLNGGTCTNVAGAAKCVCKIETGFSESFWTGDSCETINFQPVINKLVALAAQDVVLGGSITTNDNKIDTVKAALEAARDAKVVELEGKITEKYDLNQVGITAADGKIDTVKAALEAARDAKVVELEGKITEKYNLNQVGITAADGKIDTVKAALEAARDTLVNGLDAKIVAKYDLTQVDITDLRDTIQEHHDHTQPELLALKAKDLELVAKDVELGTSISGGLDTVNAKIDTVKAALELARDTKVSELQAKIDEHHGHTQTDITNLGDTIRENLSNTETGLQDLTDKIQENHGNTQIDIETAAQRVSDTIDDKIAAAIEPINTRFTEITETTDDLKKSIGDNADAITAESGNRVNGDLALSGSVVGAEGRIDANAQAIQANTDKDTTFRSFNWKSGVATISNMINAANAADFAGYQATLNGLIDTAPFN